MIETVVVRTIPAAIEDVFERLIDLPAWSSWLDPESGSSGCDYTSAGPPRLGSAYEDNTPGGVITGELVEFDRPTLVTFLNQKQVEGELAFESRLVYELRSVSDTETEVEHRFRAEFSGPLAEFEPHFADAMPVERNRISDSLLASFTTK